MIIFLLILAPVLISTIVALYNYFTAPILQDESQKVNRSDLISVLIPARNEEKNIALCLNRILQQDYKNFEILVLDDQSTDRTKEIVKSFSQKHTNVFCNDGEPLPPNWTGKNWACHQLSQKAKGSFLLFVDADVELAKNALGSALKILYAKQVKMLSIFPTQNIKSLGEWLIVPLMNWLLLSFLPLKKVYSSPNSSFIAANGQFMLWESETYFAIGGHEQVASAVVEDMELARKAKIDNKIITILGANMVFCKMYNNLFEAFKGFSKNFYPGFNLQPIIFIVFVLILFFVFALSTVLAMFNPKYLVIISLIVLSRILISLLSKQNVLINVLFHLPQMIFMLVMGINSVLTTKLGYVTWKERKL